MKKIVIFILNYLLIILVILVSILLILSNTVLKKNYIETSLEKSGFYNELNIEIQNEFDTCLAQVGIEDKALKDLYTLQELKNDISNTLEAIYNNKAINTSSSLMTEKIKSKLQTYTKNTEGIASTLTNANNKKVVISSKYINAIGPKFEKLISMINMGIIAIAVIFVIVLVIMCAIIGNFKVIINHVGILLCSSGILSIIIKVLLGNRFRHIFLLNQAFSTGIVYIINDIINKIMSVGIGFTVIGIVFIICGKYKEIDQNKEMES